MVLSTIYTNTVTRSQGLMAHLIYLSISFAKSVREARVAREAVKSTLSHLSRSGPLLLISWPLLPENFMAREAKVRERPILRERPWNQQISRPLSPLLLSASPTYNKFLTFDSNSTSDDEPDVLKTFNWSLTYISNMEFSYRLYRIDLSSPSLQCVG